MQNVVKKAFHISKSFVSSSMSLKDTEMKSFSTFKDRFPKNKNSVDIY